jgi:hypothetical protein
MKTIVVAVLLFGASFGGTYLLLAANAPSEEQAGILAAVTDAIVATLGQRPEAEPASEPLTVRETYYELQAAYYKLSGTCSAEARKGYAVAFANHIEAIDRANEAGEDFGVERDQMATMNQFIYLASRHIIEASDMPSWRFRRMVAAVAYSQDNPSDEERKLRERMQVSDWFRNDAGEVMTPPRCKPLSQEG